MKFDRRDFIRIGAAGALGTVGAIEALESGADWLTRRAEPIPPPGPLLQMRFKGLCLLEHQSNAKTMVVHLVDARSVRLGEHLMKLTVPENAVNSAATKAQPDCIEQIGSSRRLTWHLRGRKVAGPPPQTEPDLTVQEDVPAEREKPNPDDDEGWKSLHWVPDLRSICGATKILKPGAATIALNHGEFRSVKAEGSGPHTVWKFMKPDGTEMRDLRRRLTNQVLYICPSATALTISVDSEPIVFNAGANVTIEVENQPICRPDHGPGQHEPNMEHFRKFYDLVDASERPAPTVHEFTPPRIETVEPNYCPPGRIRV
jgi:hypothetical protein